MLEEEAVVARHVVRQVVEQLGEPAAVLLGELWAERGEEAAELQPCLLVCSSQPLQALQTLPLPLPPQPPLQPPQPQLPQLQP